MTELNGKKLKGNESFKELRKINFMNNDKYKNVYFRYSKKDYLEYADSFDYSNDIKEGKIQGFENDLDFKKSMKKWKIDQFRDFYGFTHKNRITGQERDYRNYACLDCLEVLRPDFISSKDRYYCVNCL
jgi:hypothetical protein